MLQVNEQEIIKSIKKHEGFRSKPYPDPITGVWTFGYGFTNITKKEAEIILRIRITKIKNQLKDKIDDLPEPIQETLIEMAFQLGVHGLMKFKNMWAALKEKDYEVAALEVIDSILGRQVPRRAGYYARKIFSASKDAADWHTFLRLHGF